MTAKSKPTPKPSPAQSSEDKQEENLDEALQETFPASDPVAVSPLSEKQATRKLKRPPRPAAKTRSRR